MRILPTAVALAIVGLQTAAPQSNDQLLPAGPEKDRMAKLCVGCHEVDLVVARRHTRAEWDGVMEDMAARGAEGSPQDLSKVAEFLATYLGKVNVNSATIKQLQEALKIPEKDAHAIVAWREQNGKFKNFEEVRRTPGLDAEKIGDKRGWMAFE